MKGKRRLERTKKEKKYLRNIIDRRHWNKGVAELKARLDVVESCLSLAGCVGFKFLTGITLEGNPSFLKLMDREEQRSKRSHQCVRVGFDWRW